MGQEALPPSPAAVAFSWEHAQGVLKPAPAVDAPGMPQSPAKQPATVVFSWEQEQGMMKPAVKPRAEPESVWKAQAPTRRLSVPPPPGRPSGRFVLRAVRPEEDPFLAAYLACTKSTGGRSGDGKKAAKGQRRFAWSGLGGLSCKRGDGAVAHSMVRLATLPEVDPRDA